MKNHVRPMEERHGFCYNLLRMEEFKVTIEKFEGPLDLMLHLIKETARPV